MVKNVGKSNRRKILFGSAAVTIACLLSATGCSQTTSEDSSLSTSEKYANFPKAPADTAVKEQQVNDTLKGAPLDTATTVGENNGYVVRIVEKDGEKFPVTMDFSASRLNFTVEKNRVTNTVVG